MQLVNMQRHAVAGTRGALKAQRLVASRPASRRSQPAGTPAAASVREAGGCLSLRAAASRTRLSIACKDYVQPAQIALSLQVAGTVDAAPTRGTHARCLRHTQSYPTPSAHTDPAPPKNTPPSSDAKNLPSSQQQQTTPTPTKQPVAAKAAPPASSAALAERETFETTSRDAYYTRRHELVLQHFPTALGVDDFISRTEIALSAHGFRGENSIGERAIDECQ